MHLHHRDVLVEREVRDAREKCPTDISIIPEALAVDEGDKRTPQSEVMKEIIATKLRLPSTEAFYNMSPKELKLSRLKEFYKKKDKNAVALLASRHRVSIDEDFTLKKGAGQICMDTKSSMIDYHLTVGKCLGFSPLLPNVQSDPQFCFELDLKSPTREFKGKNAMLGFDPAGRMLYLGRCRNEDVFLAMAPNEFLEGHFRPTRAGYSTGSSQMARRHYRQTVMMLTHFLAEVTELSYVNNEPVYTLNLDSEVADFHGITDVL
jgi:hypothetical protein